MRELAGAEASAPRRGAGRSGCSRASDAGATRLCRGRLTPRPWRNGARARARRRARPTSRGRRPRLFAASDAAATRPCRGAPDARLAAKRRSCESRRRLPPHVAGRPPRLFAGVRRRRGTALPRAPGAASRGETALVRELAGSEAPALRAAGSAAWPFAGVRRAPRHGPAAGRPAPRLAAKALVRELAGSEAPAPRRGVGRTGCLSAASTLEWRGASYYRASKRPSVRPCAALASGALVEDSSTTPQQAHGARRPDSRRPHNQAVRVSLTAARLTALTERTPGPARLVKWWSSLRWTPTSPWVRPSGHKAPPCHVLLPLAYRQ